MKIYQTGWDNYDIRENKDYIDQVFLYMKHGPRSLMSHTRLEGIEGKTLQEANIRPFPVDLEVLIDEYMKNHPEIDWFDEQFSSDAPHSQPGVPEPEQSYLEVGGFKSAEWQHLDQEVPQE